MIGLIVPVPKEISETGYIKIVGDSNANRSNNPTSKWELLAVEYDIEKKKAHSLRHFEITKKEVEAWIANRPQNINIFGGPTRG